MQEPVVVKVTASSFTKKVKRLHSSESQIKKDVVWMGHLASSVLSYPMWTFPTEGLQMTTYNEGNECKVKDGMEKNGRERAVWNLSLK